MSLKSLKFLQFLKKNTKNFNLPIENPVLLWYNKVKFGGIMTKYLVKIISICCFIVLIPVIIAGVALCAVGSSMHKLSVYVVGADSANASYSISVGEKDGDKKDITAQDNVATYQNNSEIHVSTNVVGYDFQGWFSGDDKVYVPGESTPLTTDLNYSFTLNKDTQLTAVYKVKTYTIKFQGTYEDDTTPINLDDRVVTYGETIAPEFGPLVSGTNVALKGWKVAGEAVEVGMTATFEKSGTYIVEPVWSNRTRINYILKEDGQEEKLIDFVYLTQAQLSEYALPTMDDPKIAETVGEGYEFVRWETETGAEITSEEIKNQEFDPNRVTNIYLKRNLKEYTLNISNGLEAAETIQVKFDVKKMFDVNEIKFTKPRMYYSVVGLRVNDVDYLVNGNDFTNGNNRLSTLLLTGNVDTIDAEAIWACDYQKLGVTFSALSSGLSVYGRNGEETPVLLVADEITGQDSQTFYFASNDEGYQVYDLADLMFSTIFPENYESYCIPGNEEGTWKTVSLSSVKIYYNGFNSVEISKVDQADFAYAIELILEQVAGYDFTSRSIKVEFVFA